MRRNLITSVLYTAITAVLLGVLYPLLMTGLAQTLFHDKANGQLISKQGVIVGSRIIGQAFTGPSYFHGRPSAAGPNGYDPTSSGGSNFASTSKKYVDRVTGDVAGLHANNPGAQVPIDLVTASGSGLDPDLTPSGAAFQIPRIAKARGISEDKLKDLVARRTSPRQFGFLGEPRVNVLQLNLDLDSSTSIPATQPKNQQ